MAELKPRMEFEGRTRLETVIPLSTPYLVFLDPSDVCNASCSWCPTGRGDALKYKKPKIMKYDLYRKIIDDLASMPEPIKTLRLYSDGEPLLNPRFGDMVRYARTTRRFKSIDTTTNGTVMNLDIITCGLNKIFFSIPEQYDKATVLRVLAFYRGTRGRCEVYVKTIGDRLNDTEKERFLEDFSDISDKIFIENLSPCWPAFEVKGVGKVGIYGQPIQKAPKVCPYIFYSVKINSDGLVSLCFLDYRHDMILGDLRDESFSDIWNGQQLKDIRILNLRKYRAKVCTNCANCGQLIYGAPDNLDPFADEILKKIS